MTEVDYTKFGSDQAGDFLSALSDDAQKWAQAFVQVVIGKGMEIDEGLMIAWFANAIEHSNDVRRWRSSPHSDDRSVDLFATAMKAKMAKSREKGRGGWDDPEQCDEELLLAGMNGHLEKGDMVDIGNYAMMIWNNRQRYAEENEARADHAAAVTGI